MTPEKLIENKILAYLYTMGVFCWKIDRQGTYDARLGTFRRNTNRFKIKGVSDILGITKGGTMIAIEVKTKTGRVSPDQKKFIEKVKENNGIAFVARSLEDVIQELNTAGVL